MTYISERNIIHNDIACRNLLVTNSIVEGHKYLVKVGDLGLGKNIQGNEYYKSKTKPFAVKWSAPEGNLFLQLKINN